MYALFTLFAGACQSAMGSLNRMLTDYVGMFGMSLVVHAVGGILPILYMKLFVREKLKISGMPWYLYTAGFFGIFLVVTSSYCIGILGVSVMTCLSDHHGHTLPSEGYGIHNSPSGQPVNRRNPFRCPDVPQYQCQKNFRHRSDCSRNYLG